MDLETEPLFGDGKDSSQLLTSDLEELVRAVRRSLDDGRVPMITHGTDSLATTGFILSQVFPEDFMVLTAAFRPIGTPDSDALGNIEGALMLSSLETHSGVPKVPYVAVNGQVFLASSLVKLDTDFGGGRRGFKSYRGAVGNIVDHAVQWNAGFVAQFQTSRLPALQGSSTLRTQMHERIRRGVFRLARVELAYVNEFTPAAYLASMFGRLRSRQSDGLVLSGVLGTDPGIVEALGRLTASGRGIFVENFSHDPPADLVERVGIPVGIQPSQLWSKLTVFGQMVQGAALKKLLGENFAGEIAPLVDPTYAGEKVWDDFYISDSGPRGFLLYFQHQMLFQTALIAELERLKRTREKGGGAELVIEGLGNGHIFIGNSPPPAVSTLKLISRAVADGIRITIVASPRDAVPNGDYEVGHSLQKAGATFARLPGRRYLQNRPPEADVHPPVSSTHIN